jgi:hypothetical protein
MDKFTPTLAAMLVDLPEFLVWLTGIILAVVFWQRHPKASLLTLIAMIGFMTTAVVSTYLSLWLPLTLQERGMPTTQIGLVFAVYGIIRSLVSAIWWGLLVAAIFGRRGEVEHGGQSGAANMAANG